MRKVALSLLLVLTSVAFAQMSGKAPFSADMKVTMKNEKNVSGKVYFNGDKMRQDFTAEGHQAIQIIDFQRKVTDMLMPEQKMYMEMNYGENMRQHRGFKWPELKSYNPSNPCAQLEDTSCEKVGTETVNGRSTDKWIFKSKKNNETTTAWLDHKIMYPIRTVNKDFQMDLTNVREGMPDASLFEIPAGYRKFDMGEMMRGQMPPMPNPE